MARNTRTNYWLQLLFFIALLVPWVLLLLGGGGVMHSMLWFWMILFILGWLIFAIASPPEELPAEKTTGPRMLRDEEQPQVVRELMDVRIAMEQAGLHSFRGPLHSSPETTFEKLKAAVSDEWVPLLQEDEQLGAAIILMPRSVEQQMLGRRTRPWLNWTLFGLTIITTTWAGAVHQGVNLAEDPWRILAGLPYAVGLMLILGLHELGHYFTARRHNIHVTPPYFIPVPFALGTFGAFIQMKSPTEDRRALFDVAVAGPLAGLIPAIPALLIGLHNSEVIPGEAEARAFLHGGTSVGSSLLFALLARLSLGEALQVGYVIRLSPLAFAGWLGLLVTALNLLPIGQLDGGHITRALFGQRIGQRVSSVAMWSLFLLAIFVWPGLLLFALIVFFLAGRSTPPLNDLTPVSTGRQVLGFVAYLLLALILIPLPHAFWTAAGIYCPYA